MSTERWPQIKKILESALEQSPDRRAEYVRRACQGDVELQREVEAYLRCDAVADEALPVTGWRKAAPQQAAAQAVDLDRAGAYRILEKIGEGGTGIVYLAERDDGEYVQRVAVKVIKAAAPQSVDLVELFRNERRILARLEHPNIARMIDSGTTGTGQPYYVMEYVDGVPVDTYCRERRLGLRERLRLFCTICAAVGHAHRHLIIHRDLKPGNILVTRDGIPKLLDFGLAKILKADAPSDPTSPATVPMLTPDYASPEQIMRKHLTTATDVYSLGVLLYKLLTGRLPYGPHARAPLEMMQAICEQDPLPPSQAVRSASTGSGEEAAPAEPQDLRGDLDHITLKALRKEPERRYASVEELRQDVERYLDGFPVRAAGGAALYRLRKYARRHRWGMAVSLVAAMAGAAAAAAILWQSRQAGMRFEQVRGLARAVIFDLHDAIEHLPGSTAARKLLVERALEYLNRLEATGGKNRDLQLELAAAYKKIGDVQGNPNEQNIGDAAGAMESYHKAREILQKLRTGSSEDPLVLRQLADVSGCLGDMYFKEQDMASCVLMRREAAGLFAAVAARDPGIGARKAAALARWNLAEALNMTGDWPRALEAWRGVLAAYEELARLEPGRAPARRNVALAHKRLGAVLGKVRDFDHALEHYRAALAIDAERVAADPVNSEALMDCSFDHSDIGWIYGQTGRRREAAASFERALELREKLAAADPNDYRARTAVAQLLIRMAVPLVRLGQLEKAAAAYHRAAGMFDAALKHNPADHDTRLNCVRGYVILAEALLSAEPPSSESARKLAADCCRRSMNAAKDLPPGALTPRELQALADVRARLELP